MTKFSVLMEQKRYPNEIEPVFLQQNELNGAGIFPYHFHDEIEILYVHCGKIAVSIFNDEYIVSKNQLCYIPSMAVHSIKNLGEKSEYDCCLINIAYFLKNGISINQYSFQPIITDNTLINDFTKLRNYFFGNDRPFRQIMIRSLGTCFLINLIEQFPVKNTEQYAPDDKNLGVVKEVSEYLKEHADEQIDIDAICHKYGYSPSYMSRLFKKYTKTTMNKTLNYYRCANAQRLIMTQNISIMNASEICGFNNYSYFAKTYKAYIGELPSDTKKKYENQFIRSQ